MQLNSIANPTNPLNPASPLNPANPLHPNNRRAYQTEPQKCDKCGQVIPSHNDGLIAVVIIFSVMFAICACIFVVIFDALRDAAPRR